MDIQKFLVTETSKILKGHSVHKEIVEKETLATWARYP